ncbi:hypothetical protein TWF217_004172 [Orbilia oligospora]|nr:hypothetical protein TWF128_000646 [Orbilia oligospora]KAF3262890.1 hypothetical protein TWF217_004172 [Orbilia oligospora]
MSRRLFLNPQIHMINLDRYARDVLGTAIKSDYGIQGPFDQNSQPEMQRQCHPIIPPTPSPNPISPSSALYKVI